MEWKHRESGKDGYGYRVCVCLILILPILFSLTLGLYTMFLIKELGKLLS